MWVRKLQKFAIFHIFGDVMVFSVTISVVSFSLYYWASKDIFGPDVTAFNKSHFALYFGTYVAKYVLIYTDRKCHICLLSRRNYNTNI